MVNSPRIPAWLPRWAQGDLQLREDTLAPLVLVSGKIVACDPLVGLEGARPFTRTVKPGKYKVVLGVADGDVVLACLKISRAKVASWEVARCDGDPEGGRPGFGVDSGNACFVDAEAAAKFVAAENARDKRISARLVASGVDPADPVAWHEAFDSARVEAGDDLLGELTTTLGKKSSASAVLDAGNGANLVAFKSGAGDGTYASYWGLDAKGKPALLLTDFGLAGDDDDDEEEEDEEEEDVSARDEEEDELDDDDDLSWDEEPPLRIERPPVASPLLPRARQILVAWEKAGKMELEEDCDREALAEALLERLVSLEGHRHLGAHLSEWLMERSEVADVFATDEELEEDIRKK